jgi:uncharacterized membrane protein
MEALIVLLAIALLAGPVLAVVALVKVSSLNYKIQQLMAEVARLSRSEPAPQAAPVAAITPKEAPEAKTESVWSKAAQAETETDSVQEEVAAAAEPEPTISSPPPRNVEQALASRWLVWLGGAAIGLGGLLMIKYAHDNGLVPPIVRVIIGLVAGAALVAAGEWVRQKRGENVKDFVPAALSAAGLVIAFGVTYAAYALYNIVAPAVCFPLLAAISLGALWLSQRQGQLIAALGLVGATVTPALISTPNPSAAGFFAYLLVIVVASLWLLRKVNWWWLGYAALASGTAWALLWIGDKGAASSLAIGIFGLATGAAALWVPRGRGILDASMGSLWDTKTLSPPMGIAVAGCVAGGIVLSALAVQSGHAALPLIMFAIGMAAIVAFGWFRDGLVAAPLLAAVVSLIVLLSWRDVGFHELAFDERGFWVTVPGLFEPPRFRNAMLFAMIAFAGVGIFGVLRKSETRPWALLAAGSAFLFLFGAWGRADFTLAWQVWALIGLVAAAALGFALKSLLPKTGEVSVVRSIEVLTVGISVVLLFVLDRTFDGVWLTLAVAALATAIAYATRVVSLPNIGGIAAAIAGLAALKLFVGREFWGEPQGLPLGAHWVLYGYGVPALLFWQAARWLNREGFERWKVAFEGVSLGLLVSLVSLELRVIIGGGITKEGMGLLELAAHGCAWLGAAYGLAYRQQLYSSFISIWGARVLLAASTLAFVAALTARNPVFSGDTVVGGQVFNALWLAYLLPVPLYALIARKLEGLGLEKFRSGVGVFALVLLMTFVTLLVKRQFQDATIDIEFLSQAESYAVSLAWLVTGIGIFIAGIKLERQTIRYGGLAILVLTVLKVFGFDLFSLGGLWRIASVIGLGLCLVGVGWLYTRFIGPQMRNHEKSQNA